MWRNRQHTIMLGQINFIPACQPRYWYSQPSPAQCSIAVLSFSEGGLTQGRFTLTLGKSESLICPHTSNICLAKPYGNIRFYCHFPPTVSLKPCAIHPLLGAISPTSRPMTFGAILTSVNAMAKWWSLNCCRRWCELIWELGTERCVPMYDLLCLCCNDRW